MSPTYGYVTKLFLESEFQHKGINKQKNSDSQQNLAVFLTGTDSDTKLFRYYTKRTKEIFGQNCHHKDRNVPLKFLC